MSDSRNGTVNELGDLHGMLTREIKSQIKDGSTVVTKEGDIVKVSVNSATLNVARQFLKDNGIECLGTNNKDMQDLAEELPFDETPTRQSTPAN